MSAKIIDGEAVAEEIQKQAGADAAELAKAGRKPRLTGVLVGDNPGAKMYAKSQATACDAAGIDYDLLTLSAETTQDQLAGKIASLNADETVTGIILLTPLPQGIDARAVQVAIDPRKDVEGMHPENMGRLFYGGGAVAPCTALAAVELLVRTCPDLAGKETVIVGHSEIVGKPVAAILLQSLDAAPTVTVCHVATKDLAAHTRRAEVLIVAAGVAGARWQGYLRRKKGGESPKLPNLSPLISADMLAEGAVVIDVAINRIPKGFDEDGEPLKNKKGRTAMRTVGDVDFEAACEKVAAITPVPGGVGPVTVAMLLANTVACAKAQA